MTVKTKEENSLDFCPKYVQEFNLKCGGGREGDVVDAKKEEQCKWEHLGIARPPIKYVSRLV